MEVGSQTEALNHLRQEVKDYFDGVDFGSAKHLALADIIRTHDLDDENAWPDRNEAQARQNLVFERSVDRFSTVRGYAKARKEINAFWSKLNAFSTEKRIEPFHVLRPIKNDLDNL